MDYDQIGEYLEHRGLSDDQIDDFLEHHGVKGQKWGVRRAAKRAASGSDRFGNRNNARVQRRVDRVARVAQGKASVGDMIRATLFNIPVRDIVAEGGSIKGGAQHQLDRNKRLQNKISSGKRNATDIMLRLGGTDIRELNLNGK